MDQSFPDKSVTARAEESRMGSGKGAVDYWVVVIKPGNILFELSGTVPAEIAKRALKIACYKLQLKQGYITGRGKIKAYQNILN